MMPDYVIKKYLPAVRLNRDDFEKFVELIVDEFSPERPFLRIKDDSADGKTPSANSFSAFVDHPDVGKNLHMVKISARDAQAFDASTKQITMLLYNNRPELFVESDDYEWAESAATRLYDFACKHRPWHFSMHNLFSAVLAGAGMTGILYFPIRLVIRIASWNVTPDLLLTSLAGTAGSISCFLMGVALPLVEIQLGTERDKFLSKAESTIRVSAALAVLLLIARHWA
jgi:hypothetical protein